MRFIFYIYLISQLLYSLDVFGQKEREDSSKLNKVKWEKVEEESVPLKKIIWKSYNDDEGYFEDEFLENKLDKSFIPNKWRFRPAQQWYFNAQRKGGSSRDMQLLGGKIDWMVGDWWYLTGQGLSAYEGGAGGYSEGYLGIGVLGPSWKNLQLYGEMLIGAGGGGGVDSGSALLYKPSIGLEYSLNEDFSLQTGIGKVISNEGNLDANTLDFSLIWRFGTLK